MIVFGAGGFANQILPTLERAGILKECVFYDDVNPGSGSLIHRLFHTISTEEELKEQISYGNRSFIIAVGKPENRRKIFKKLIALHAIPFSLIDSKASVSDYEFYAGEGIIVLNDVIIEPEVQIGKGTMLNVRSTITHNCKIGEFCEISPGSILLGGCSVGDSTFIGAGTTILPGIHVGNNCVIGAGSLVNKSIPDGSVAYGNPVKITNSKS